MRDSHENRDQEDRKLRRSAASSRIDAAARPQARSATPHYRTAGRRFPGIAVRSRFRTDDGDRRRDHGKIPGYACDARQMSEPPEPIWITYEQAIAIHSRQLRRFGGAAGLRDEGMLRS